MITKEYCDKVLSEVEKTCIHLEVFSKSTKVIIPYVDAEDKGRVSCLYVVSSALGGALAMNYGLGWVPVFPGRVVKMLE